ncbi:MAG TPA: glycosyltransferase family 4 protein [Chloroflexia bacterium]|jgi:glycosyltransferase involved in cell wall biosynthesis
MEILILSQHFAPEPGTRLRDLTRHLVKRGHTVSVVTTYPSYPLGKVYQGYRLGLYSKYFEHGAPITRVFAMPYRGLSIVKRMLSYFSFALAALLLALLPGRRPRVAYVYHPPLTTGLAAAIYNLVRRVPFVYDVQDLWPDAIVAAGMLQEKSVLYRGIRLMEDFVYRRASHVNVLSDGMRRNLMGKGVPADKISVISNWGDPDIYHPTDAGEIRDRLGLRDRFVVMSAGNMGLTHGLETVIEAAAILQDDPRISVVFVGSGAAKPDLIARTQKLGLRNVSFHDQVSEDEAAGYINAADVMLIHLKPVAGGEFSVPSRIFSYMLCGKPIIAASEGSTAELIRSVGCGWTCAPSDPHALAGTIRKAAVEHPARIEKGELGLAAAHGEYSRAHFLERIERGIVVVGRGGFRPQKRSTKTPIAGRKQGRAS